MLAVVAYNRESAGRNVKFLHRTVTTALLVFCIVELEENLRASLTGWGA